MAPNGGGVRSRLTAEVEGVGPFLGWEERRWGLVDTAQDGFGVFRLHVGRGDFGGQVDKSRVGDACDSGKEEKRQSVVDARDIARLLRVVQRSKPVQGLYVEIAWLTAPRRDTRRGRQSDSGNSTSAFECVTGAAGPVRGIPLLIPSFGTKRAKYKMQFRPRYDTAGISRIP